MDEPMSSLDSQTAAHLRIELKQLQRQLGITSVYVTHDLNEAINMADRIAILNSGEISQVGTAEEIFFHPCNAAVMNYLGSPIYWIATSAAALDGDNGSGLPWFENNCPARWEIFHSYYHLSA